MLLAASENLRNDAFVLDYDLDNGMSIPDNVISWWSAENNTSDDPGNNDGVFYPGPSYAAGKVGQAFSLGGGPHVRVATSPELRVTQAITVTAWVYPTATAYGIIVSEWDAVPGIDQRSWGMDMYSDRRAGFGVSPVGTAVGAVGAATVSVLPLNTWTHLVGTYDGSYVNMYVNGVLQAQSPYNLGIFPGNNGLGIGGLIGGLPQGQAYYPFPGRIDEAGIYGRAWSTNEVWELYNAASTPPPPPVCIAAPPTPVAWWPGDSGTADIAGSNPANAINGAYCSPAKVAQGFTFDGVDDYLEIPDAPALNPGTALTVEAWVKVSSGANVNAPIFSKDQPYYNTRSYLLTVGDSGRFRAHIWTGSGTLRYFDGSTGIQLNTWYHVAMTYDGSYLRLYVNGAPDGSTLASGNIRLITDPLRIGGSYSGGWGNYKLHGQIDEPTLYHRALTPSEISAIYMAGAAGKCKSAPSNDTDGDGLLDAWEMLYFGHLNYTATSDPDSDGLSNSREEDNQTNPTVMDSDADGFSDGDEVLLLNTNPRSPTQRFGLEILTPKRPANVP